MEIASVVGARPQFIKLGMIDLALQRLSAQTGVTIDHRVLHTGQHYDENLSQVFFEQLGLPEPNVNLGIGSGTHGEQTGKMLEGLDACFAEDRPDLVLTYGDTNSTLAAALAAVKLHIAVGHVESGLRSHRKTMPEEVNRLLTDHVSTILLCPTAASIENLCKEGLGGSVYGGALLERGFGAYPWLASPDAPWVLNVGDVMYDSVLHHSDRALHAAAPGIADLAHTECVVLTIHRAENTDDEKRLSSILAAASRIADGGLPVVFPAHPRTLAAMTKASISLEASRIKVLDPLSYYDMLALLRSARLVLTDSGGVQREAFMLGRPCVTLREETEWVELLNTGMSLLGGAEEDRIVEVAQSLLDRPPGSTEKTPYGDGHAAERIAEACIEWIGRSRS